MRRVIRLESVDPESNRCRHYELETEETGLFVRVERSWGRAGARKRKIVRYLALAEAEREVRSLLGLRARHGYEVVGGDREWARRI